MSVVPPSLAWFWNPSKKIIYGDCLFWYPIGNTPARNLFEGLGPASSSVLLLGCGDVRNVLESCRQSKSARKKLAFALNDFNSSTIARDVLLLTIADQIDASNVDDVDFLWSVWYNLRLSEKQFLRLREVVKEILDRNGKGKPWLKITGRDWKAVKTVYRSWIVDSASLPDVDYVQELRKERTVEFVNRGELGRDGQHDWEGWIKRVIEPSLTNVCDASMRDRGMEECRVYVETGSINRDDPGGAEIFFPNVTLLHPQSRRWLNHYGSSPFPAYRPIVSDKNLREAGGLVKACQRRLQEWVVALQIRTRLESPTVEVSLHCSDALEFCLCGDVSRSFDVIDTTNLADHVGLLNLVVCAGPRLAKNLGSRLSTSTLTWVYHAKNLRDYVDKALSFDSKFAPTILGLRLVTDLETGKSPIQTQDFMLFDGGGHDERRLDWQPAPPNSPPFSVDDELIGRSISSNKQIPAEPEPCAAGVQLPRLVRTCCFLPLGKESPESSDFRLSSPTTLALLLKNMGSRCVMETSGKAPLGSYTEWCKNYCPSFGLEVEKVARLMDPSRGGLVEVRGQLYRDRMLAAIMSGTPIVRVGLVHRSTNVELVNANLMADLEARKSPAMSLVHVIDNVWVDEDTNVRFLLPEGHGLEASEWEVVLIDLGMSLGTTLHSFASLESMEQVAFNAPVHLAIEGAKRGARADKNGLRIAPLKEYGDRFVAHLSYDSSLQDSKFFPKSDQADSDGPSLSVELGFRSLPGPVHSLNIDFPSPVMLRDAKFKRRRSKQEIECIFPKSSIFPANAVALELIDIEGLPDHKDEEEVGARLGRMFSVQELMFKFSDDSPAVSVDPFYDLRNTIQILFVKLAKDGIRLHLFFRNKEEVEAVSDPLLSLVVLGSVKRMDDGEPALLVSYVDDLDVKAKKKAGRLNEPRFVARFSSMLDEFGKVPGKGNNFIFVGEEELKLLRKTLAENSARLKPSRWQAKHVEEDSEWRPSFIKPMYPENVRTAQVGSEELSAKVGKMSMEDALVELTKMMSREGVIEANSLEEMAKVMSGGPSRPREGGLEATVLEELSKMKSSGSSREGGTKAAAAALPSGFLREGGRKAGGGAPSGNTKEKRKEKSVATNCGNCGSTSELKRCGGCRKIWYCGRDCQKEHRGVHKHQCGKG
ncbi:hypothetical protein BSKO_05404 [Bryopsis sp. KO-2023]|nr:hypothetical protein BSKO_05404 [Bryopsis sp. KO-2023]